MTKYEAICESYRANVPRMVSLDKAVRDLPDLMRCAVRDELQAPDRSIYLARPGAEGWERCSGSEALFQDRDDVLTFALGLHIPAGGLQWFEMRWEIALEEITHEAIKLVIRRSAGSIDVRVGDPNSYAAAAQKIGEWMLAQQSDPRTVLGDRLSIGFGCRS